MFDSHVWKEHARRDLPQQGALAHVRAAESKRKRQEAHEHRCLGSSSQVHCVTAATKRCWLFVRHFWRATAGCFALAQMSTLASARCKRAWNPRPNWVCTLTYPSAQGLQSSIGDS